MNAENNKKVENLLNTVSKHLGTTPEKLKQSAINGNMSNALNNLDKAEAEKIQKILNDKDLSSKLLSSPQAQQLIKDLLGDK